MLLQTGFVDFTFSPIVIETIIRPEYTKYTQKKSAPEYARTPIFVRARIYALLSDAQKWASDNRILLEYTIDRLWMALNDEVYLSLIYFAHIVSTVMSVATNLVEGDAGFLDDF